MHRDHEDKTYTLESQQRFSLEVDRHCGECDVKAKDLESLYLKGIRALEAQPHLKDKMHGGVVKVFFVSDEEIRQLNRNYRDKDLPTDVISLSYFEESPFPGQNMIGEIFISIDTAHRQAKEHRIPVKEESTFLFVHGLLHVFGFDHEKARERKEMFTLQDRIMGSARWRVIAPDQSF